MNSQAPYLADPIHSATVVRWRAGHGQGDIPVGRLDARVAPGAQRLPACADQLLHYAVDAIATLVTPAHQAPTSSKPSPEIALSGRFGSSGGGGVSVLSAS